MMAPARRSGRPPLCSDAVRDRTIELRRAGLSYRRRVSPGEWWESAEASGQVRGVSLPRRGWAIA